MNEFQAAERHQLEEPAADIGLEPLCAMVNNNVKCYELATELSAGVMEALTPNYAEQVWFLSLALTVLGNDCLVCKYKLQF
jgi:exocyst complex component 3